EKNTNWEGAYRVPCVVRWPGKIKPGTVSNEIFAHHDWLPTFLAMAGVPEVTDKLLKGYTIGDMTYKVHLDGYNLVPYLTGEAEKSPRVSFIYCNDDQQVVALRYDNWKIVFAEQREPGTMRVWSEPFVTLRVPKIFNLRTDPFRIPSSVRTSLRSPTTIGLSITSICWCPRRHISANSCRLSGTTRSARRPPASTSTTCSAGCRRANTRNPGDPDSRAPAV